MIVLQLFVKPPNDGLVSGFLFWFLQFLPGFQSLYHCRDERDDDNGDYDQFKIVLDEGNVAEKVAQQRENSHPDDAADDIPADEEPIGHPADSGHEWRKGAYDRHKTCQKDRLTTLLFEEGVCTLHVLLLDPFDFASVCLGAHTVTDPVVDSIPDDGSDGERNKQHPGIERAARRERGGRKDERIARQEGRHHQTSLHKNDEKKQYLGPSPIAGDDIAQVNIYVQDEIYDL